MGGPDLLDLVDRWDAGAGQIAHRRLAALLDPEPGGRALRDDTLGQRNRRLIALFEAFVDRPIEAHVACLSCATANEFVLPLGAIKQLPDPPAGARAEAGGRQFRLPTMADLDELGADPQTLARRCALEPGALNDPADIAALGDAFERLDPLAHLEVASVCSHCGANVAAEVDLAEFVAAELTRFIDLLLRDIDVIARAYGWNEREIATLPPARRARYVAMIAGHQSPSGLGGKALG